jgi:hypothetical protein
MNMMVDKKKKRNKRKRKENENRQYKNYKKKERKKRLRVNKKRGAPQDLRKTKKQKHEIKEAVRKSINREKKRKWDLALKRLKEDRAANKHLQIKSSRLPSKHTNYTKSTKFIVLIVLFHLSFPTELASGILLMMLKDVQGLLMGSKGEIDHAAHLGGALAGLIWYGMLLYSTQEKTVKTK